MAIAPGRLRHFGHDRFSNTKVCVCGGGSKKEFMRRSFSAPGTAQREASPNVHYRTVVVIVCFTVPGSPAADIVFSRH